MQDAQEEHLLDALPDSWNRNHTILLGLLRILPENASNIRPMEGSQSVAELFSHIHYVRLVFVEEDAPEFARSLPEKEWSVERDCTLMAQMLNDSAKVVGDAVRSRVTSGRGM